MKQIAKKIYNLFTYFNPEVKKNFETSKIGTIYGGYDIYEKFLKNPVVISCGLGEDASFDIDMINKYKAKVIAVDPTPRSIQYYEKLKLNFGKKGTRKYNESGSLNEDCYDLNYVNDENFMIIDRAIWKKNNEKIKLFFPVNKAHVSLSINKKKSDQNHLFALTVDIESICKKFGLNKIDILKLDIEGAEIEVLKNMLSKKIFPQQLLIEYDIRRKKSIKNKVILLKIHKQLLIHYDLIYINNKGDFTYIKKN